MQWSKSVAKDVVSDLKSGTPVKDLLKKWKKNWKPYKDLSEAIKEKDRVWARKTLHAVKKSNFSFELGRELAWLAHTHLR